MKEAIHIIKTGKQEIFDLWEEMVKETVPASAQTNDLALRDHLPQLFEDILDLMGRYNAGNFPKELFEELKENSVEHGRHRASTSYYTIDQILQEYIIFHQILTKYLQDKSLWTEEVNEVLNFSIEHSMLYASRAFNESLQEMRQKLIGILAHDMRNPISAALFAVDVMEKTHNEDRLEKLRRMARNSLKRSMDLIEGLLDSVTVGAGEGMTLDFAEIDLMETIHLVHEEASEVYSNKIELQAEKAKINGVFDSTMLRRMLENLISNAIKYGDRERPISLWVVDSEEVVILKVHNWGNPIPEEDRRRIFHFLNSNNSNGARELKSWGMGLTLARAVAEAHGGQLEIQSREEEGTTFSVDLVKNSNSPGKKRVTLNFR